MLWLVFALVAALSNGFLDIIHRKVMITEDPYAYALLENLLVAAIFIPVMFLDFSFPKEPAAWFIVALSAILWVAIALIGNNAYKYAQASVKTIISQSRVIFVLIFSVILLSETFTWMKFFGVAVIFLGLAMITYKKGLTLGSLTDKGVQLTFLNAILAAIVAIIDKKALSFFTPGTFGFLAYLLPAIILVVFGKDYVPDVRRILKTKTFYIGSVVVLSFVMFYFQLKAFALTEVSNAFPIIRLSPFFGVIFGITILKEKNDILKKILSILIILLGVYLMTYSG